MPRKAETARSTDGTDWYLVEWMRSKQMTQARLGKETGWSKATVNDIYHGKTRYYRDILNECARALQVEPYELLMHPDLANAIKQQRKASLTIVESAARTGTAG